MNDLEYVSIVLVNGQVIISRMSTSLDENDYYTMIHPLKPILLPESNKIALIQHNPFSESIEFQIHASHVITMGALDATYVTIYDNAVEALTKKVKRDYDSIFNLDEEEVDEEMSEDIIEDLPISKTLH